MSDLRRLWDYARAFELATVSDEWSVLRPLLAEDATHLVHSEPPFAQHDEGADAVIAGLRRSVDTLDRRFDARLPEVIAGPLLRDDGVWMRFRLRFEREGLEPLEVEGDHLVRFEAGRIAWIEEWVDVADARRVAAYLERHDAELRPAGLGPVPGLPSGYEERLRRSLVRGYGHAKLAHDVDGALAVCRDDFVLETPSLGSRSKDKKETDALLRHFFQAFPDYTMEIDEIASGPDSVACWGTVSLTMRDAFVGLPPTGRTAELFAVSLFDFRDGQLARERFLLDGDELCRKLGLSLEEVLARTTALDAA